VHIQKACLRDLVVCKFCADADADALVQDRCCDSLAAGATHEAVAHRLEIPLRTTRRRMRP